MISTNTMIITGIIVTLIITFSVIKHFVQLGPTITKENGYLFDSYSDDDSFSSNFDSHYNDYWLYDNDNITVFDYSKYATLNPDLSDPNYCWVNPNFDPNINSDHYLNLNNLDT